MNLTFSLSSCVRYRPSRAAHTCFISPYLLLTTQLKPISRIHNLDAVPDPFIFQHCYNFPYGSSTHILCLGHCPSHFNYHFFLTGAENSYYPSPTSVGSVPVSQPDT